jgi:hypothetical protein
MSGQMHFALPLTPQHRLAHYSDVGEGPRSYALWGVQGLNNARSVAHKASLTNPKVYRHHRELSRLPQAIEYEAESQPLAKPERALGEKAAHMQLRLTLMLLVL